MTDMRATERLLEVIEEAVSAIEPGNRRPYEDTILKAVTELRRRGDTLVRAEDLRMVLKHVEVNGGIHTGLFSNDPVRTEAWDRLENTLGTQLR